MKEIEKLFGSDFKVVVSGIGSAVSVHQDTLKYQVISDKKQTGKNVERAFVPPYYYLGSMSSKDESYEAVGKLARVPLYTPIDGVLSCGEYPEDVGCVLIDINGKIVTENTSNKNVTYSDKYDVTKVLYVYGPCALAFVMPEDFGNRGYASLVEDTFRERIEELQKQGVSKEILDNEVALYEQAISKLKSESLKTQNAEMQF